MDLSKPTDLENSINKITQKIDGLIYCAGLAENRPLKMSDPNFTVNMFNVNYFSFIELMRLLTKNNLFNANSSSIVISSVTSQIGEKGKSIYSGTKGALESSVRSIVKEISIKNQDTDNLITDLVNITLQSSTEEFNYQMQLAQIRANAEAGKIAEVEDRKDKRTKIQATQQSELIDQRKNDLLPKDFESQGNDGLGGFNLEQFTPR
jgi:short-subunit dehydrogenase